MILPATHQNSWFLVVYNQKDGQVFDQRSPEVVLDFRQSNVIYLAGPPRVGVSLDHYFVETDTGLLPCSEAQLGGVATEESGKVFLPSINESVEYYSIFFGGLAALKEAPPVEQVLDSQFAHSKNE